MMLLARPLSFLRGAWGLVSRQGLGKTLTNFGATLAKTARDALAFLGLGSVAQGEAKQSAWTGLVILGSLAFLAFAVYSAFRRP